MRISRPCSSSTPATFRVDKPLTDKENQESAAKPGLIRRAGRFLSRGTTKLAILMFLAGIIFWGGFHTAMDATNTLEFCTSCHEMYDNVFQEYQQTIHFKNRSGVRATCSDCHVPREWSHKVMRKIYATNELWHKLIGTVDTPEKFNAHRLEMAERVWASMRATDSRECRNCHAFTAMDPERQDRMSVRRHDPERLAKSGDTCIDCHQGIAHTLPEDY